MYNTNLCISCASDIHGLDSKANRGIVEITSSRMESSRDCRTVENLSTSYRLSTKELKEQSKKIGTDEVFNAALIGGLVGAAAGIGIVALIELMKDSKK